MVALGNTDVDLYSVSKNIYEIKFCIPTVYINKVYIIMLSWHITSCNSL